MLRRARTFHATAGRTLTSSEESEQARERDVALSHVYDSLTAILLPVACEKF